MKVLVSSLNGYTIIELSLINSIVVGVFFLLNTRSVSLLKGHNLSSLLILLVRYLFESSLLVVPEFRVDVIDITDLDGHTIVEFVLID